MSATIGFTVVYRCQLHDRKTTQFMKACEDSRRLGPCDAPAFEDMRDATEHTFEPMLLTPLCDHLVSE